MRDPNSRAFWLGIAALIALAVPYPFAGRAEPLVAGVPLWFVISLLASIGLVVVTVLAIRARWSIEDHVETRDPPAHD